MPYHPYMPGWLAQLNHGTLTRSDRALLEWLWWCGDRPCTDWNYQLAARIGYSKRAVQLSLSKLLKLGLILIDGPFGKHREIIAVKYEYPQQFLNKSSQALVKSLAQKLRPPLSSNIHTTRVRAYYNPFAPCRGLNDVPGRSIRNLDKTPEPTSRAPCRGPNSKTSSSGKASDPCNSKTEKRRLEIVYQVAYDKLRSVGWSAEKADRLAQVKVFQARR